MPIALNQLPDDIDALKSLVAEQVARNEQLSTENQRYKTQVLTLQEQLNLALAKRYAASSEKISPDQVCMFNEAEAAVESAPDADDEIIVPAHTRKKRGRKPLPDNLPRVDVVHELPESKRHCDHDGQLLVEIGEVISEQLDIIPAKIQVIRHVRKKYACNCGKTIKTAPLPAQPIPKSMASPGLLAHVAVSKYADGLPLYRVEKVLQRGDIDLPRSTLASWMVKVGELVQPLINLMREEMLSKARKRLSFIQKLYQIGDPRAEERQARCVWPGREAVPLLEAQQGRGVRPST